MVCEAYCWMRIGLVDLAILIVILLLITALSMVDRSDGFAGDLNFQCISLMNAHHVRLVFELQT